MDDLKPIAQELLGLILHFEDGGSTDAASIQRAKTLHMQLAPVYRQVLGGVPLFQTEIPQRLWVRRAKDWASQALAAIESGYYTPPEDDGWLVGELPILQAVLDRENEGSPIGFTELVESIEVEPARAEASLRALIDGHFVTGIDASTFGGFDVLELRLTARGRQVLGGISSSNTHLTVVAETSDKIVGEPPIEILPTGSEFEFDVAVSYATADGDAVSAVVDAMKALGIRTWIDRDHEAELWGSNLERVFADVFASKARYVMVFLSETYTEREWTRFELDVAQSASRTRETAYVLPVIVDEHVPAVVGLPRIVGFVSLKDHTPEEIARLLRAKIGSVDE